MEWQVARRGRGRRHREARPIVEESAEAAAPDETAEPPAKLLESLARMRVAMAASSWARHTADALAAAARHARVSEDEAEETAEGIVWRLVCYGLGSVFASRNARWQLAFALWLRDDAKSLPLATLEVYDPILGARERAWLSEHCGVEHCAPPDSDAACVARTRTLFYMPHCPMPLYARVVRANLADGALRLVVVLGNSFASYAERRPSADLDPSLAAALELVAEVRCDPGAADAELERAFNDSAVMSFPTSHANAGVPTTPLCPP